MVYFQIHPIFEVSWKAASALYKVRLDVSVRIKPLHRLTPVQLVSHQYESDRKLVDTVEKMRIAYKFSTAAQTLNDKTEMLRPLVKQLLDVTIECCRFVQEYTRHSVVGMGFLVDSSWKI